MNPRETYEKMCDHPLMQENSGCIWYPLPGQDDIQEMMLALEDGGGKLIFNTIAKLFGHFQCFVASSDNLNRFNSFEQLWLAFYMHEKHKLKWEDGKWQ